MAEPALVETELADDLFVWTLGGDGIATSYGANCTAVLGKTAVLLVDPFIAPAHARLVEEKVREKTPVPVRHVVLTHHHTDHALGAGWFASRGATVHAHRACRGAMAAEHPGLIESRRRQPEIAFLFRDAEPYLPARVFDESLTLDLGGTQVRVLHPGHNHTPGDAVLHVPESSTVVCGDLVSSGYHVNYEDADIGQPRERDPLPPLARSADLRSRPRNPPAARSCSTTRPATTPRSGQPPAPCRTPRPRSTGSVLSFPAISSRKSSPPPSGRTGNR